MRLLYVLFIFSQPLRLLVALCGFVVARSELLQAGDCRLGIDTLIANILV